MGEPERLRLLEAALQAAGELWTIVDAENHISMFGDNLLGHAPTEVHGRDLERFVHPEDLPRLGGAIGALRSQQTVEATTVRLRMRDTDGLWHWTELTIMDRRSDPAIGGIISRVRPLAVAEVQPEEEVTSDGPDGFEPAVHPPFSLWANPPTADDAMASLAEVVPAAILTADRTGRVVYTNQELRRLLRGPVRALAGNGWSKVVHADDVASVARSSAAALNGEREDLLFRIIDADDLRWLRGHFAPMRIAGEIVGLVAVFDDVTAQRERESQLAHQATHDPLTGLPNRVLLRDRLSQALGRLARTSNSIAALFIDLDGFKHVNDDLGHRAGDEVLIEVARRMLMSIRPTDTVARLGGDEFMVISEGQTEVDVRKLCDRLAESLVEPIATTNGEVRTSAAIGAVVVHRNATVDEVIHQADAAMYRAKRVGPASYEVVEID